MSIDKAPNLIVSPKERGGGINDESNHAHTHSHTHRYTHIHTLMLANTHNTHTTHTTHTHARTRTENLKHARRHKKHQTPIRKRRILEKEKIRQRCRHSFVGLRRWVHELVSGWLCRSGDWCVVGWMGWLISGWMGEWVSRWMGGRIIGQKGGCIGRCMSW